MLFRSPYKGKGIAESSEGESLEIDSNEPDYMHSSQFKSLDNLTKNLHKYFGGAFLPNPNLIVSESAPIAVIIAPDVGFVGEELKLSGELSSDQYSTKLDYEWRIEQIDEPDQIFYESEIYWKPQKKSRILIRLFVTNSQGKKGSTSRTINIVAKDDNPRLGNPFEMKSFYDILTKNQKVLCPVYHGVTDIIKPTLLDEKNLGEWLKGKFTQDLISDNIKYNTTICEIVNKCITKYNRKKILIFANSVKH